MTRADVRVLAQQIVPPGKDAPGWASDISSALEMNAIRPTRSNVCSVMAVIGQESTFTANPEVAGLGRMAEQQILLKLSSLPVLPGAAALGVEIFLATKPAPEKSYLSMIRSARTERDLDLVYRNLTFYLFREYASTRLLNAGAVAHRIDAANPVSTLGSMQVSAAFTIAEIEKAKNRRLGLGAVWKLRDELYTRKGGVAYGTRMLLGYRAEYPSRLFVFADYNAGRYASRNTAFQYMVAELSGKDLALDGDLMLYESGKPKAEASVTELALRSLTLMDNDSLRADLLQEKDFAFRDTDTYRIVSTAFTEKAGKPAPYAMLPQIRLKSPKIHHHMTTEIFARAVMRRYDRCMAAR
ncbi:MAG: DUF1615 family protein [Aestuariivirga sp.]|uniref:DUF1615 family protein n=1 Tax=Aestuariivirga sp. TaxID=2650926 RepID=UPI003015CE4C